MNGIEHPGAVYNDSLYYFMGNDPDHGVELWYTNGTDTGTRMIQDYKNGTDGTYYSLMYAHGKNIWLSMNDQLYGYELFILDATHALSAEDIEQNKTISLYPNPNNGQFSIRLDNSNYKNGYVKVVNAMGQIIYDQSISPNQQQLQLNLAGQPPGTYIVSLVLDGEVMTGNITVQ